MPTREGLAVLILAAAVFLLATNLMSGLLFVFDALLVSLLLVGAATALLPTLGMQTRRRAPARGVEGIPMAVQVEVSAARPGRFLVIEDGPERSRARTAIEHLPRGQSAVVMVRPVPRRRGHYELRPVEVISRGAVGLVAVRRRFGASDRLIVWPRLIPPSGAVRVRLAAGAGGQGLGVRTRQPEDYYGVRDYQPGDTPNRIHWKLSARRGALVVREYERPVRLAPAVVVDLDHRQTAARLDAGVRAAASLLHAMLEQRPDVVMLGWDPEPIERAGWEAAMDWLAGVAASGPPLAEALSGPGPHVGRPLIVVASTGRLPHGLLARLATAPGEDALVVVPAEEAPADPRALVYSSDGRVQTWQAGAA